MIRKTLPAVVCVVLAACASTTSEPEAAPAAEAVETVEAVEEVMAVEAADAAEVSGLAEVSQPTDVAETSDPKAAQRMFERLKTLEGTWVQMAGVEGASAEPGTPVTYRVTSAGSAVIETVFEGQPHEMVTVYYVDNGRLKLTHYCAMGNQPHMLADPITGENEVSFEAVSVGNEKSMNAAHMHWANLRFVDDAHIVARWTISKDGKPGFVSNMHLERKAAAAAAK